MDTATTFAELGLNEHILAGVDTLGFSAPTPVQAQAIPAVLDRRDVVASAQTGTGKTAAFTLPALQVVSPRQGADRGPHALVITPTRELAQQIDQVAATVAASTGQTVVTVIGGERYDRQIKRLASGCDMLVATPGRLIDLMDRRDVDLSHVEVLVLDEADRMLDMGFWPSVRKIIARLPHERQTLLFSATISGDIQTSMPSMLKDPVTVEVSRAGQTADTVEQRLVPVVQGQKVALLNHLIASEKPGRVLVFCRTKQRVDAVAAALERGGLKVGVMHADRRQKDRERALKDFRSGALAALVATDVMSRGIDVSDIDWVVNFDVPLDPEDYVHRIGRTGRAGETGIAFTFLAPDEVSPLREIEYFTKELVPVWEPEGFAFDAGRIVPNAKRATSRSQRSLFNGSRSRGRGPAGGRFGRHA
jgi:ATP-dependent RNA helicase RhlE